MLIYTADPPCCWGRPLIMTFSLMLLLALLRPPKQEVPWANNMELSHETETLQGCRYSFIPTCSLVLPWKCRAHYPDVIFKKAISSCLTQLILYTISDWYRLRRCNLRDYELLKTDLPVSTMTRWDVWWGKSNHQVGGYYILKYTGYVTVMRYVYMSQHIRGWQIWGINY